MTRLRYYLERDADPGALDDGPVAVVGHEDLGWPATLNLRASGLEVLVGSRSEPDAERAREDGLVVVPLEEAIAGADVVWLALPDEAIPDLRAPGAPVRPRPGALLVLSSGYFLAYDLVKPSDGLDVGLLAPGMIGQEIRRRYLAGEGFCSYVSVEQDASGTARRRLLALAAPSARCACPPPRSTRAPRRCSTCSSSRPSDACSVRRCCQPSRSEPAGTATRGTRARALPLRRDGGDLEHVCRARLRPRRPDPRPRGRIRRVRPHGRPRHRTAEAPLRSDPGRHHERSLRAPLPGGARGRFADTRAHRRDGRGRRPSKESRGRRSPRGR